MKLTPLAFCATLSLMDENATPATSADDSKRAPKKKVTSAEDNLDLAISEIDGVFVSPPEPDIDLVTDATPVDLRLATPVERDRVYLRRIKHKSETIIRKSFSVHLLQMRLAKLGYGEATADRDGQYGDLTERAVMDFQRDNGLQQTGRVNRDLLERIFDGDETVELTF